MWILESYFGIVLWILESVLKVGIHPQTAMVQVILISFRNRVLLNGGAHAVRITVKHTNGTTKILVRGGDRDVLHCQSRR